MGPPYCSGNIHPFHLFERTLRAVTCRGETVRSLRHAEQLRTAEHQAGSEDPSARPGQKGSKSREKSQFDLAMISCFFLRHTVTLTFSYSRALSPSKRPHDCGIDIIKTRDGLNHSSSTSVASRSLERGRLLQVLGVLCCENKHLSATSTHAGPLHTLTCTGSAERVQMVLLMMIANCHKRHRILSPNNVDC